MTQQIPLPFLLTLLLCATSVHSAQEGEKGRPKNIPRFESYPGASDKTVDADLQVTDLEGKQVYLKDLWKERPLLLVHSSLTCPISRDNCPHVDRIMKKHKSDLDVVVLYTTEAHPIGSPSPYSEEAKHEWITDRNVMEEILVNEPTTIEARLKRAKEYRQRHGIQSTMVVDKMSDEVWKYFGAGPNCGVLIDRSGKVVSRQGWLKPSLMEGRIRELLMRERNEEILATLRTFDDEYWSWSVGEKELIDAIEQVPEIVHYHLNRQGVAGDATYLHVAVDNHDIETVRALLKHGANPNAKDRQGLTPLHYALKKTAMKYRDADYAPILQLLLDKGAEASNRSDDLRSSLFFAVESGRLDHFRIAREAGAMIDEPNIDGITPLHQALFLGHREIADTLISANAGVDIYGAAALGDMKQLKRVLAAKPNMWNSFQGDSGRTPLMYAAAAGQTEVAKHLLNQQSETDRYSNEHLINCLNEAVKFKNTDVALAIIPHATYPHADKSPEPDESLDPQAFWSFDIYGAPLIHNAARADLDKVITALIKQGWDVDQLNADEATPLHVASTARSTKAMETLIRLGANVNVKTGPQRDLPCGPPGPQPRRNETPLHFVVVQHDIEGLKLLLKHGAKLDARNYLGETPLLAILRSYEDEDDFKKLEQVFRLLVSEGADVNAKNSAGKDLEAIAGEMVPIRDDEWKEVGEKMRCEELFRLLKE